MCGALSTHLTVPVLLRAWGPELAAHIGEQDAHTLAVHTLHHTLAAHMDLQQAPEQVALPPCMLHI